MTMHKTLSLWHKNSQQLLSKEVSKCKVSLKATCLYVRPTTTYFATCLRHLRRNDSRKVGKQRAPRFSPAFSSTLLWK